ncbi:MAG: glycosyltransferase family 2 protein [Phycisphaerae bacterium]
MISVVVPIYNEHENLPALFDRLSATLESVQQATGLAWEVVCVNDGSRDDSEAILAGFHQRDPRWKVVQFSRNFGHQPAVTAGIHHASGDAVVLIDGDLQDPPEVIAEMVAKWREGYQVVVGERRSRADGGTRGVGFKLFYPLFRLISDLPHAPDAGIFGLMDRRVVEEFNRLPERNRFIPGLRQWLGFKQTSVYYDRQDRAAGKPKQTLRRLWKYAVDGMLSFSYKPLKVASWVGFGVSALAFLLIAFYIGDYLVHGRRVDGFTTLITVVLFMGGVQLLTVGILGEYVGRMYEEMKQRPLYVVQDRLGLEPPERRVAPRRELDGDRQPVEASAVAEGAA